MPPLRRFGALAFAVSLSLIAPLASRPAAAMTIVPLADVDLVRGAPLVVEGRVVDVEAPVADGRPRTGYVVAVDRVLAGSAPGSLLVRVPGGVRADGIGLRLPGMPTFSPGERALLFLAPRGDGSWRLSQLAQGAFHVVDVGGRALAVRDFGEVTVAAGGKVRPAGVEAPRDLARFAEWIERTAAGDDVAADYRPALTARQRAALAGKYTLFEADGRAMRWTAFDTGADVPWRAYSSGQPGVPGGGFDELQRALQDWNADPATNVRYSFAGTTTNKNGLQTFDSLNTVLFGDPNKEISDTFDCGKGGTLAFGGPWYDTSETTQHDGRTFVKILAGDIVTNDGIECTWSNSPDISKGAEELFAHELGHTLGLDHSSENKFEPNALLKDALMYYLIHDDARGGRLNDDDRAGLRVLYGTSSPTGPCAAGDTRLCLLSKRFSVTVTWRNQYNGASGSGHVVPVSDLAGFVWFTDPANLELMVKILDFGNTFKVFYGELTNLQFTITVTDSRTGAVKTYANTPGDCGAIDPSAFTAAATAGDAFEAGEAKAACSTSGGALCLLGGRFRVEGTWRNPYNGASGTAKGVRVSDLTGRFSFDDPANVEILVKTLDFGDHVLVLYGALSDFEYALKVTDLRTGAVKTYSNPPRNYCGGIDANAF